VEIELLTVPDCPNRRTVLDRLDAALVVLGNPSAHITERVIDDPTEARAAGMRGSPTILLDGRDPFADADLDTSVSCRLFRSTDGVEGAPSVDQLIAAISPIDASGDDG
jgi:hypothetical protein